MIGVYFEPIGSITLKDASHTENHICDKCLKELIKAAEISSILTKTNLPTEVAKAICQLEGIKSVEELTVFKDSLPELVLTDRKFIDAGKAKYKQLVNNITTSSNLNIK